MTLSSFPVLVVDDRPANRYIIVHALRRAGFGVIEATTGKEALELANNLPKVIVLDVKLPDILGYEVCRRIKANARTSHIPVLQLSAAFLSDESKVHALESGADAFLTQPVEPNVLIATVKSLARLHDAETQTRRLAEQWQATFDALTEGVALIDVSGVIQRSNRAMAAILGLSHVQIEGRSFIDLLAQCFGITVEDLSQSQVQEVKFGTRYFRFSLTPVVLLEISSGSIFILSEITEQKLAQAALVVNERLAATGRMANTIAHEINNPLEAITNLLYLLNTSLDTPEIASQFIASAQEELSRVSRIARQILSFNRDSSSPVSLNVSTLLEDVLALNNREIQTKEISIRKELSENAMIDGFPAQLRQVFSNLLRNAIEASEPGQEIRLRICRLHEWGRNKEPVVRVSFADHGVGISKENIDRIYEAFYTTKELKGSGIGLWLSANIVQEHRGCILVRSRDRQPLSGTCFSIILPAQRL